jgi:hypothetical protein
MWGPVFGVGHTLESLNEAAARSAIARNANNEVVIGIMAGL